MPTLDSIYRDINSYTTNSDVFTEPIVHQDVIKAINDGIRKLRREYTSNGLGHKFSTTETIYSLIKDFEYPFLNFSNLSNRVDDSLEITDSILAVFGYEVTDELLDEAQSFSKGDLVMKGDIIYKAVDDIDNINTYEDTFQAVTVRNFYKGNELRYTQDDIVYDVENDLYYKVNTDFTNDSGDSAPDISELDKLYWKKEKESYIHVSKYPFYAINTLRAFDEYSQTQGIVVNQDKIYATKGLERLTLTYIPEWEDITDLDEEVIIPDFMVSDLKNLVINKLLRKRQFAEQELNEQDN